MESRLRIAVAEPSPPPVYDPLGDDAGLLVLRSPKLSAADKLAWGLIRQRTDSGRKTVRIHPRELAEHQGVTTDAGRQRLKNLRDKHGLIQGTACNKTGFWDVILLDPRDVLASDVTIVAGDPQPLLPFMRDEPAAGGPSVALVNPADTAPSESLAAAAAGDAPSVSAQPRAAPPLPEEPRRGTSGGSSVAALRPSGLSGLSVENASATRPLTIGSPSGLSAGTLHPEGLAGEEPRRGTSGASSAELDLARLLAQRRAENGLTPDGKPRDADELAMRTGAAIGAAMAVRLPDPVQLSRMRERWIDVIRERVRDPQLKTCVMVKVAAAVVAGELKPADVEEVFAELDKHRRAGTLRAPSGVYFLRAAQALFRRYGLEWTGYASGGRRKPR